MTKTNKEVIEILNKRNPNEEFKIYNPNINENEPYMFKEEL